MARSSLLRYGVHRCTVLSATEAQAQWVLPPQGRPVAAKVLQVGAEGDLLARLKREFPVVRHVKPKASRADSVELYLLATGFKGRR
jgi:23S rRNA (uridine2552-2'-O)-methyltransferase